jgi:hypothetical protein
MFKAPDDGTGGQSKGQQPKGEVKGAEQEESNKQKRVTEAQAASQAAVTTMDEEQAQSRLSKLERMLSSARRSLLKGSSSIPTVLPQAAVSTIAAAAKDTEKSKLPQAEAGAGVTTACCF